jgi:hypothetical protein
MYLGVLLWLSIGVLSTGLLSHMIYLGLYALVCIAVFLGTRFILQGVKQKPLTAYNLNASLFLSLSFVFSVFVIAAQLWVLGKIPFVSAALSHNRDEINLIRQAIITDTPSWLNYLTSIEIRAILPLLGITALMTKRYIIFSLTILLSLFFCAALMQKSYIALVFLPVILFALYNRHWSIAFVLISVSAFVIVTLVFISNPLIRPSFEHPSVYIPSQQQIVSSQPITDNLQNKSSKSKLFSAVYGISERILIVPGAVVSTWFTLIPKEIPFGKGCGDRFIARLLQCKPINFSVKVFEITNPDELKIGIRGTVNAASFMEGYANFGLPGLFISGIEMGLWLAFVSLLLGELNVMIIIVNALYILLLSSASLHTLLLSGGWAITILLSWFLRNTFKGANSLCAA